MSDRSELVAAAREVLSTELGGVACTGSMAPCEDALGKLQDALNITVTAAGVPAETVKAVIVVNDVGNELAIERRDDGKWQFTPTTFDGQRPQIATPSPSAEVARDAARLDFFDGRALHVHTCYEEGRSKPVYEVCIVHGDIGDDCLQCIGSGATLRDAISAAMKLQAPAKEQS